jgi:hypothetical protein
MGALFAALLERKDVVKKSACEIIEVQVTV